MLAFSFAVMADPVSSVAYAIEAALRALNGDLALLVPTMSLVVAIIALVILNYRQLVIRYPQGGGAAAATGEAFGDRWSFIPIGALVVDFVLTIAISVSAGASAAIAYFPSLAPWRLLIALGLVVLVGGITWFGHVGRLVFAAMTVALIVVAAIVLLYGLGATPQPVGTITSTAGHPPVFAVVLAFPVAMALATGVEAPSSLSARSSAVKVARISRRPWRMEPYALMPTVPSEYDGHHFIGLQPSLARRRPVQIFLVSGAALWCC